MNGRADPGPILASFARQKHRRIRCRHDLHKLQMLKRRGCLLKSRHFYS